MRRLGAAVLAMAVVLTLAACDPYTVVRVQNDCGYEIDIRGTHVSDPRPSGESYYDERVPPGEDGIAGVISTRLDLYVRVAGQKSWPVKVPWDDVRGFANSPDQTLVIEGDLCPSCPGSLDP